MKASKTDTVYVSERMTTFSILIILGPLLFTFASLLVRSVPRKLSLDEEISCHYPICNYHVVFKVLRLGVDLNIDDLL